MAYTRSKNKNAGQNVELHSQGQNAVAVSPSDSTDLAAYAKALRVYSAAGCAMRVTPMRATLDTDYVTLTYPAGLFYEPLAVRRVWNTGTTGSPEIHAYTE